MKKTVITTLILLFAISTLNAQFFKKSDEEIYKKIIDQVFELFNLLINQTGHEIMINIFTIT